MSKNVTHSIICDKYRPIYQDDLPSLQKALFGSLSGTSEVVSSYESALAGWFDAREAVAVSSGAAAISVALYAVGVEAGDDVLLTPSCPLCTVYPIIAAGANPVFIDTRIHNFGADIASMKAAVTPKTKAVVDIPMWGYPTEVDELYACAKSVGIKLVLDLAHSHGTTLHNRQLSHYSDVSCFSTHERKLLSTGEGGFILTDNDFIAQCCREYSRFGNLNGKDFGLNYKLAGLPAALGLSRLASLASQIQKRRRNAEYLSSKINHPQVREREFVSGGNPNYYFMNLDLSFENNNTFINYLDKFGIPSDIKRYACKALYNFPILKNYRKCCPNAEKLLASMTTVPVHPGITASELDYIAKKINEYRGS